MLSGVGVSLKANFYAMPIPLITITDVITNIRKKNIGFASLKKISTSALTLTECTEKESLAIQ